MKTTAIFLCLIVSVLALSSCGRHQNPVASQPQPTTVGHDDYNQQPYKVEVGPPILERHQDLDIKWSMLTHRKVVSIAAAKWGLSSARINNMTAASDSPDVYQSGLENGFNQQWSHAFMLTSGGLWYWGDADDDFHDNINQSTSEIESPEGYQGKSAKYYYQAGNQRRGDWYLGYACHYIEDVCLVLHTTVPFGAMATKHFAFEAWVENNLTAGHNLLAAVQADNYYYVITDLKQAVNQAAYYTSGYYSSTYGKKAWDAYVASGYPTAAGTGNAELVANTKGMLIDAKRYVMGAIKYTLDKYGQWTNKY